jgi:hypothetical protein
MMTKTAATSCTPMRSWATASLETVFLAAQKAANVELNAQLGNDLSKPCEEHFVSQASVIEKYMANEQNKVLLFGYARAS